MSNTNSPCQHPRESKVKRGVKEVFLLCEIWEFLIFLTCENTKSKHYDQWIFDFFPYMNLKIVTAIFRDALFLLFDMREANAGSPPPLSEIVQLSFRYISFHEVSHWNKPIFAIILRTTKYIRYA